MAAQNTEPVSRFLGRPIFLIVPLFVILLALGGILLSRHPEKVPEAHPPPSKPAAETVPRISTTLDEDFAAPTLDPARWVVTSEGDFEEKTIDVVRGRLRLRCATRGTRDDTVKFLGVRSVSDFHLGAETRISAELDWNDQANGSYLSAGIVLSPTITASNPLLEPDLLRIEYIGVPPGKNGRIVIVTRNAGREQYLFTEGWPDTQREGRKIALQQVEIVIRKDAFQVWENKQLLYEAKGKVLLFDKAFLYLQMSSHSNYPPREVFFKNVRVDAAP